MVLVSGSHRGTGAGTARVFAAEGAHVAVHGFEAGQADDVAAGIVADGGRAVAVHGRLDSVAETDGVVDQVEAALGPVEVLVNNYGAPVGSTWATPADDWVEAYDRNLLTAIRLTQRVVPSMRDRRWGRIVFLGTIGTGRPGESNPDYYGAKAALHAVARSLARELAGTGITANVVSPGLVATHEVREMLAQRAEQAGTTGDWPAIAEWAARNVLPNLTGRVADPEDIGRVVAFVASLAAWHINGADVKVDGGALDATPTGI